ncbi:MAG: hypothetical protein LBN30_10955 [Oscillospiraceae bacterium]|jgi:hypothetical protein|nr:hypothetical protein [Oscillospiraceae bacterium]
MNTFENHIEVIAEVVRAFPEIGKTGIMKCVYFLQNVYDIDLGYRFSMYTYGPFDSDVMGAINAAVDDEYIESKTFHYPNGTGYQFSPLPKSVESEIASVCSVPLEELKKNFGKYDAKQWELAATIVYLSQLNEDGDDALVEMVHKLKPHFSLDNINNEYRHIQRLGMAGQRKAV